MNPSLIKGSCYQDQRGVVQYNNDFDASSCKRIYIIENNSVAILRAWQGHRVEQRWFSAIQGSFLIQLIGVDNWETPSINLPKLEYTLTATTLDILHIPAGYISSIQALEENSKLVVMADHQLGEIDDEYRYPFDYFKK